MKFRDSSGPDLEPVDHVVIFLTNAKIVQYTSGLYDPSHERTVESANKNELLYYIFTIVKKNNLRGKKQRRLPRNNFFSYNFAIIRAKLVTGDETSQSKI